MDSISLEILRRVDRLSAEIAALKIVEGTGTAGGAISGSGTTNRITQWSGTSSLGDSTLIKSGVGVLTLDAAGSYTLTVPGTGTVSLGSGTLSVSSVNDATIANHTHAITSSSNPGAAASLLASNTSGYLQLVRLGISTTPTSALHLGGTGGTAADGITFGTGSDNYLFRAAANTLRANVNQLQVYPTSVNGAGVIRIIPNASPASTKTTLQVFNTDFVADSTNYELGQFRFNSSSQFDINSSNVGTGTLRAIQFSMNNSQIGIWNTNGGLQILGIADRLQFLIKNNATQTANSFEVQDSTTAKMAYITPTGGAVFNESGDAAGDVRMESDTEVNMFLLDANGNTDGTIYLGGSTNGIQITKGGELTLIGTATRWNDLRVEPVVRNTGSKAPSFISWLSGLYLYDFDDVAAGSEKEIFFQVQMPHDWKEQSTISPHVHWTNRTGSTAGQVVRWGLEYNVATIGGTFGTSTTIYGTTIVGGGDITVANEHILTELTDITMTGNLISTVLVCRLFRNSSNAADTYTGTAGLLYVDFHYEIDTIGGSKDEFTK